MVLTATSVVDDPEVVVVPTVDMPAPATPEAPTAATATPPDPAPANETTEIGDAMSIERTDDGGSITYYESEPAPPAPDGTDIHTALRIERTPPPADETRQPSAEG